MIWYLKKVIDKAIEFFRGIKIQILYHPDKFVTVLGKIYLNNPNIIFGKNVTLYPGCHIFGSGRVTLGDNVAIGDGTVICAARDISIGKDTIIAAQCYITDCNHGMHLGQSMRQQPVSVRPTKIGDNVWLGCGVAVLAGATIENGAVIGAGTVIDVHVEKDTICYSQRVYCKSARR